MTFYQYRKIRQLGHEENVDIFKDKNDLIIIQEKMDGANFRFMVKDRQVTFGSRTQELQEDKEHKYQKNFRRCIEYVTEMFDNYNLGKNLICYGECMVSHTMAYDWENIPPFLGFDIYDLDLKEFLNPILVKKIYTLINLKTVPELDQKLAGEIKEVNDEMVPESKYFHPEATDKQAEGIVFKNYSKNIFAKYVRDAFKERNSETFGGNPKYNKVDETDNAKIAFKYCTNARIDKAIFNLVDEGHKLETALMKELPHKVYDDIMSEEWQEIVSKKNKYKVDFGKLKKLITTRCLSVLKQMITNNALK